MLRLLQINRIGLNLQMRFSFCGVWVLFLLLVLGAFTRAQAASEALVVVGLTGSETDQENFTKIAELVRTGLIQHGFKSESITLIGSGPKTNVTRESILAALQSVSGRLQSRDEFWLVLLGHSGRGTDGQPAFQVRGPRLTAVDLQGASKSIKAKQTIFLGMENSGAYIPLLKSEKAMVVTATDAEGESNQPRFPEKWAQALNENPSWSPVQVAARASELVEKDYDNQSLAQGETAMLYDPVSNKILSAPFVVTNSSPGLATRPVPEDFTPVQPSDIEVPKEQQRYHRESATSETKAIIAEGLHAPNPDGHSALVTQELVDYTVNSNFSTAEEHKLRVYIVREEAVDEWANYSFPNNPGLITTKIGSARVILPDGSSYVMNIDKVSGKVVADFSCASCPVQLLLPEVHAGCAIDIAYRIEAQSPGSLPFFYDELQIQHNVPVLHSSFTLKLPKKGTFKYRLKNSDSAPVLSETDNAQVVKWTFSGLPAYESLPFDPPQRDLITAVQLGSINTWNDFISWYRRISKDSDKVDPEVAALAKELARDHTTRQQKMKAAFEYVSNLRYVAIEFGVHGFRPHTPAEVLGNRYGDCKDKANLLATLLREMKISASIALINRMSSTDSDFPGWQFNHAITYVPPAPDQGQADGLWLDTTDTATPFGFIAPGNLRRTALVLPQDQAGGQFLTVTDPNQAVSKVQESWEWEQGAAGRWNGTLKKEWDGMADYETRLHLKHMTPAQRQFFLQQELTEEAMGVDFTNLSLSNLADLSAPVRLTSRVSGSDIACGAMGSKLFSMMAPPTRNRPLVLNDGQPLSFMRKVRVVYSKPVTANEKKDMKPISWQGGGLQLDFQQHWTDDHTCDLVEKIDLTAPVIAMGDYATVRSGLQQWLQQVRATRPTLP